MTPVQINFLSVKALPDADIAPKGVVSRLFVQRGVTTFHEAAEFLHRLPYGRNSLSGDSTVVLSDGYGTCTTKHGLIVRLANELALQVFRCEGFYKLTDSIVNGVNRILADYKLPYIPRTHCFLWCSNGYVDLTEGNCTGKNGQIREYTEILQVQAEETQQEIDKMYCKHFREVCKREAAFAELGIDGMFEALEKCIEVNNANCGIITSDLP